MVNERIIEGGAIENDDHMSMEVYSSIMKKKLGKEYLQFVKYILKNYKCPKNAKIVEIGPGPDWIGIWLITKLNNGTQLYGIEPSKDMIEIAQKNAQVEGVADQNHYLEGTVENLHMIEDHSIDLVISHESLHHWVDPKKGFQEILRVLKSSGKICVKDSRRDLNLGGKLIVNVLGKMFAGKMHKYWKSSIAASYTPYEIASLLQQIPTNDWKINSNFMEIYIENF